MIGSWSASSMAFYSYIFTTLISGLRWRIASRSCLTCLKTCYLIFHFNCALAVFSIIDQFCLNTGFPRLEHTLLLVIVQVKILSCWVCLLQSEQVLCQWIAVRVVAMFSELGRPTTTSYLITLNLISECLSSIHFDHHSTVEMVICYEGTAYLFCYPFLANSSTPHLNQSCYSFVQLALTALLVSYLMRQDWERNLEDEFRSLEMSVSCLGLNELTEVVALTSSPVNFWYQSHVKETVVWAHSTPLY